LMERLLSIAAIYVPLDGMNEKGLIVADLMAGDRESTQQQTDKTDLTTTTAIRLLLDRAATVDEAIELLQGVDMHSSVDSAHHFSIADRSGKSVVVEYIDGVMSVTETKIVTNHYLTDGEKYGVGSEQSHTRFGALQETWRQTNGVMSAEELAQAMSSVAQYRYPQTEGSYEKTMWTIVYDAEACQARFFYREDYTRSYTLTLGFDDWCIE
ncbi:MAG: carcinine hydrolase/isopenicillin-N N-acyltransferase family protein, partial [Christensenellaceae bacterium]